VVAAAGAEDATLAAWLFTIMSRNALPATEFFRIPSDRVVELG
jgi:KUP system potassium uptake protein